MKTLALQSRWLLVLLFQVWFALIYAQPQESPDPVKWSFSKKEISANTFQFNFKAVINKGWHLYSHDMASGGPVATAIVFDKNDAILEKQAITTSKKPREKFEDLFGMIVKDFDTEVTFSQIVVFNGIGTKRITGYVEYMSCDNTMCRPPAEANFEFTISLTNTQLVQSTNSSANNISQTVVETKIADSLRIPDSANVVSAQSKVIDTVSKDADYKDAADFSDKSLLMLFALSFLAGLMAILTPCVFPMIPMTVTFFMKKDGGSNKMKALVYGISIIAIYTIIGTIVAVTLGANFANWLSTHWLPNILFFLIFVVFAASFLGMFEITLPSAWVNKADRNADKGGYTGAFFMAFTLVLVSFSCTGPLVGAILVKSAGGAVLEPIIGMLGFSLAFALPFSFFAFFPSLLKSLPKSGGWLNSVKVILGFIELALGLKFLSIADQTYHWGLLDRDIYLALWIVIFSLMGFYLLGKLKLSHDSDHSHITVPRLALAIVTFTFVVYLIPGMFGAPLKALAGYLPPQSTHDFDINQVVRDCSNEKNALNKVSTLCDKPKYADFLHLPHGLDGYFDYNQGLQCAKNQQKPVFLVFTGHGCVNCREMEATVWSHPKVLQRLREDYVIVALYVDDKEELPESEWIVSKNDGKMKKSIGKINADFQVSRFKVNAQPYYALLDENGNLIAPPKAYDLNVDSFIEFLDAGKKEFDHRLKPE